VGNLKQCQLKNACDMSYSLEGYYIHGDNIVLDILGIAYKDLGESGFTSYIKLIRIINKAYPSNKHIKINHAITTVTSSHWFGRAGKNVHLTERGVEFYLQLLQSYQSQKNAQQAIDVAQKSITIAWYSVLIAFVTLLITIFAIIKDLY
jgi:hypothetical protein